MVWVRNYGRNVRFSPRQLVQPRTVEELQAIVQAASRLRAVGAAHSWSPAIVTEHTLVSFDRMRAPIAVDRERRQVTVQAGMRLFELNRYLDGQGLALANLGSIDQQSVAGVIATGTHGTGGNFRCLSAQVARLEFIDGLGQRVTLERGHPDFAGVVVGLGAIGIVHAVTFDVVDAFQLHDVTSTASFDQVIENIEAYVADHDHFKLWWLPPADDVITYCLQRTDAPANDRAMRRWLKERVLSVAVYRSLVTVGQLSGRRLIPSINRLLTRLSGKHLERIAKSHIGFLTPSPPVHREAEWAFDLRDAKALLRAYREVLPAAGHTYNFIQEVRFTKADDLWLSPAYQRDTMWLSLYNMDRNHWAAQVAAFEAFARAHGGRPHWGKEATFDRAYLRRQYPRFDDFAGLTERYDPQRKFRNAWVDAILD
jgi:L-gulono-1,4-lactone dehydrogenase